MRLALALCILPALAVAQDLRPEDRARLEAYHATMGAALIEALNGGLPGDVAELAEVMAGPPLPPDPAALAGEWSCRMLKLGGLTPLVVYDRFRCRITIDGGALRFEKLTGSQRTAGRIAERAGRLVYAGTTFVAGETPTPYADLPAVTDPAAMPQHFPDVGVVEQTADGRVRMLFPDPVLESRANVLDLAR